MLPDLDLNNNLAIKKFLKQAFANSPNRCQHILKVTEKVRESAKHLYLQHPELEIDLDLAERAALVHDLGYLPELKVSGFHPVDAALYLERRGFKLLAELIVGHSSAPEEALLRGLAPVQLSEHRIAKLLSYWDLRVKQGGQIVTFEERYADIIQRYGEASIEGQAIRKAKPRLLQLIQEVEAWLA